MRECFTNLETIDLIFMCINPTDRGSTKVQAYARDQIRSLYSNDLSNRVQEIYTFVDDPFQLKLKDSKFRFDNKVMFSKQINDIEQYRVMRDVYFYFTQHVAINIKEGVSMQQTKEIIEQRQTLETTAPRAKEAGSKIWQQYGIIWNAFNNAKQNTEIIAANCDT